MAGKSRTRSSPRRLVGKRIKYETDLRRRTSVREQRRTVLVVTNGQRTEVDYFDAVRREPWVNVTLRVRFEGGAPRALVIRAATLRNVNDYDNVWVVCDVDEFDVSSAIQDAKDTAVGLALSMPSFEVWLILHWTHRCPRFTNAAQANARLRRYVPTWDKSNLNFDDFRDGVMLAVERAKRLGEPPQANPSTGVWRLIECVGRVGDRATT